MMLGKRPRPPMRRTTSMTEFAGDIVADVKASGQPAQEAIGHQPQQSQPRERRAVPMAAEVAHRKVAAAVLGAGAGAAVMGGGDWLCGGSSYMASMVSPRGVLRRNSGDFQVVETAPFLRNCGLCKRRLGPGRDTFMYRGDTAFCSLECRQQQMNLDEKKEKCSLTSRKDISSAPSSSEQQSGGDGTVAAA